MADPNLLSGDDVAAYIPSGAGDSLSNWLAVARARSVAEGWSDAPPNMLQASPLWGRDNPVGTSGVAPPQELTMPSSDVSPVVGNLGVHPVTAAANANALRLVGSMSQFGPADVGAIRAFHGSPADFSAFSNAYIGSGEGAQAYGYGHYVAGGEGTARYYRDQLSNPRFEFPSAEAEQLHGELPYLHQLQYLKMAGGGKDPRAWLNSIADGAQRHAEYVQSGGKPSVDYGPDGGFALANTAKQLADQPVPKLQSSGHMYEVSIDADPEHMLDWDAPLSEQSQHVQDALAAWNASQHADQQLPTSVYGQRRAGQPLPDLVEPSGEGIYKHFSSVSGNDAAGGSEALKAAGIPGIRYLDQGSRAAGQGTSNYVVFNPDTIAILRKYGIGGLIAGGGAAAATQDDGQQ